MGVYHFNPRTLAGGGDRDGDWNREVSDNSIGSIFGQQNFDSFRDEVDYDAWRKYRFGVIQVRVAHDWQADTGDG